MGIRVRGFIQSHSSAVWGGHMVGFVRVKATLLSLSLLMGACGAKPGNEHSEGASTVPDTHANAQQVEALLASMTLEQKVAQMIQGEIKHVTPDDVRAYGLGSVLNGGGSFPNDEKLSSLQDWVALADAYREASLDTSEGTAGIPLLWGTDAVHGHNNVIGATIFPHNIGLGAANDPELMGEIGRITSREVAATGIDWIFAPTVAVVLDDRWGRTYEGYSDRSDIVGEYAGVIVKALQRRVTCHRKAFYWRWRHLPRC